MSVMRLIILVPLLLISLSSITFAQGQGPAAVHVAKLEHREVAAGLTFVGDIVAVRRSVVGSAVAGRVEHVYVREGEPIGLEEENSEQILGRVIVQLREKTASLELAAAQAELRLRQNELEELEHGSREEEKVQAQARLQGAEALLKFAVQRLDRTQKLFDRGAGATAEELDEAVSQRLAAEKNVEAARAAHAMVLKGPRTETIQQARARLDMASERVSMLEDILSKYTVRTPFAGFIVQKFVEQGAWVSQGDPIAEVVELDPIEIRVPVPEAFINQVRPGMPVRVSIDSLPGKILTGTVHRIVPQADERARTFPALIRLENPQQDGQYALMPGMLAEVILAAGNTREALLAPKDALIWNGQNVSLFAVDKNEKGENVARPVSVQLGAVDGSMFEVIDPTHSLKNDQLVVTFGNERLRPGQTVRILKVDQVQKD